MGVRGTLLLKASDLGTNMGSYRNKQRVERTLARAHRKKEKKVAKKLGVRPLRPHQIKDIQTKLNDSKFKSEEWFKKELELSFIKIEYTQNHPILKRFFADFYFEKHRLVVEIDGSSHKGKEEYDKRRDYLFEQAEYKVIRIRAFNYDDLNIAFDKIRSIQSMFKNKPDYLSKDVGSLITRKHKRREKIISADSSKNKVVTLEAKKQKSYIGFMNVYYYANKKEIDANNEKMLKAGLKK